MESPRRDPSFSLDRGDEGLEEVGVEASQNKKMTKWSLKG